MLKVPAVVVSNENNDTFITEKSACSSVAVAVVGTAAVSSFVVVASWWFVTAVLSHPVSSHIKLACLLSMLCWVARGFVVVAAVVFLVLAVVGAVIAIIDVLTSLACSSSETKTWASHDKSQKFCKKNYSHNFATCCDPPIPLQCKGRQPQFRAHPKKSQWKKSLDKDNVLTEAKWGN